MPGSRISPLPELRKSAPPGSKVTTRLGPTQWPCSPCRAIRWTILFGSLPRGCFHCCRVDERLAERSTVKQDIVVLMEHDDLAVLNPKNIHAVILIVVALDRLRGLIPDGCCPFTVDDQLSNSKNQPEEQPGVDGQETTRFFK